VTSRARPDPSYVVPGLLDHLTATSLDEDYALVSARRAEGRATATSEDGGRSGREGRPGRAGVVVLVAFGLLVALAGVQTSRDADQSASSRASLVRQANARRDDLNRRLALVRVLQQQISALEATSLAATTQGRAVRARLTRLTVLAGTIATRGPGVRVRVADAPGATSARQQVQASDLQQLVNGLWAVGAEAVAINGQRLTSLSAIRDAAGSPTVNYVSLRGPYTVSAIGNPRTMGARFLDTAGGQTWSTLQSIGLQFDVETEDSMVLPPATRVTLRSAHAPVGRR
jgi:uncharacterized protein YlxW (UPF0749 family)